MQSLQPGFGKKTILLDRDGVINREVPTSVCRVDQFNILPGCIEAIRSLKEAGYIILVLTNQACIGRGDLSWDTLEVIHNKLRGEVAASGGAIDEIFVCPHVTADKCSCRKPEPGLILQAQRRWRFVCQETMFVGDDVRDMEAALAAGCRPVLVLTGKGRNTHESLPDIPAYDDLLALVRTLTRVG